MPTKVNVGVSQQADHGDGQRSASLHLDVEAATGLLGEPPEHHKRIRQCFALLRTALAEELHGHDPFANSVMSPVMPALACCRCINVVTGDLRSPRPPRRKR